MPFRAYSSHFASDELSAFSAAYEAAWQHLRSTVVTPDHAGFSLQRGTHNRAAEGHCAKGSRFALRADGQAETLSATYLRKFYRFDRHQRDKLPP